MTSSRTLLFAWLISALLPALLEAQPAPPVAGLAAIAQPYVDRKVIPGAVLLVANKDKIIDCEAIGFANIAARKPMTTDAEFAIASMSKPIAATAMMMLVDEGKVSVDDPVEKYLPEFKGQMVIVEQDAQHVLLKKPAHPILIREILSHTSGLPYTSQVETPNLPGAQPLHFPLDVIPLEIRVRSYAMTPLLFEPGTKALYANAGINTAARIVEVVSGMPYSQFIDERIFQPMGMTNTTFWPSEEQLARHPSFYRAGPDSSGLVEEATVPRFTYPLSDRTRRYVVPSGGLFSTASDMTKFCQMVLNGGVYEGRTYLTAASVKAMTTKETGPGIPFDYGFGWATTPDGFGHDGSLHTSMRVWPAEGLITIFMTQIEDGWPKGGEKLFSQFHEAARSRFKHP